MGGLPAKVLAEFTAEEQDAALVQASGVADDYLRSEHAVPLPVPSIGLKVHVCRMASYFLMRKRGFDPESNKILVDDYAEALSWLKMVAKGEIQLAGAVDATPDVEEGEPSILSGEPRGW